MGATGRMRETKATILALLIDAYQKRDRVGMITFRGQGAELVLPPTRSVRLAHRRLADLATGGATPLAHGLALAREQVVRAARRTPRLRPLLILITDGRANVGLSGGDPWQDALDEATRLACLPSGAIVVDTETGPVRLGLAGKLAQRLGCPCHAPEQLTSGFLSREVREAILGPRVA